MSLNNFSKRTFCSQDYDFSSFPECLLVKSYSILLINCGRPIYSNGLGSHKTLVQFRSPKTLLHAYYSTVTLVLKKFFLASWSLLTDLINLWAGGRSWIPNICSWNSLLHPILIAIRFSNRICLQSLYRFKPRFFEYIVTSSLLRIGSGKLWERKAGYIAVIFRSI